MFNPFLAIGRFLSFDGLFDGAYNQIVMFLAKLSITPNIIPEIYWPLDCFPLTDSWIGSKIQEELLVAE